MRDVSVPLMIFGRRLRPGESFWETGATYATAGVPTEPDWCTVEILAAQGDAKARLAQHCIKGQQTSEGACE